MLRGLGETVPKESQNGMVAWIGLPDWSLTWYVKDLVTPQPVNCVPPDVKVQLASDVVESVPGTIDRLVGT